MKIAHSLAFLFATTACAADVASAGWWSGEGHYIGQKHDAHFNNRFLQRPCPPYHGWNRPFYGWSSNYRPYYFTPQTYANTPWGYGPHYNATVYGSAAPTPGLNAYGVPVQSTTSTQPKPTLVPPTPPAVPTPAPVPQAAPTPASPPPPPMPEIPAAPQPSLK